MKFYNSAACHIDSFSSPFSARLLKLLKRSLFFFLSFFLNLRHLESRILDAKLKFLVLPQVEFFSVSEHNRQTGNLIHDSFQFRTSVASSEEDILWQGNLCASEPKLRVVCGICDLQTRLLCLFFSMDGKTGSVKSPSSGIHKSRENHISPWSHSLWTSVVLLRLHWFPSYHVHWMGRTPFCACRVEFSYLLHFSLLPHHSWCRWVHLYQHWMQKAGSLQEQLHQSIHWIFHELLCPQCHKSYHEYSLKC